MKQAVTVIGGANVDIGGRPAAALALHDSNPGFVTQRFGGVGRNLAHNLALLGLSVSFITALGGDLYGSGLRESCCALGMDLSMALLLPDCRSSTDLYVADERGEMPIGLSDMDITRRITPAALVWADLQGWDLSRCAAAALRAGAVTCACEETVHPQLGRSLGV